MYGDKCEYCDETVQPRTVKREAFKYRDGFVNHKSEVAHFKVGSRTMTKIVGKKSADTLCLTLRVST